GGLPQHFLGHRRRAGGEIKDAHRENLGRDATGLPPAKRARKEMAACARAQTAIIALSSGSRQTRPFGRV
ncbi:hypothetical protein, partial [Burkholderia cenocepacia]|uniref:hypothetical protein n=1 Tax=Burkholderia cenocepacia TaxID=95486 RepID=UPI0024B7516A